MTDMLFGQSYYLRFDPKLWDAMQPYPPLGTLYAASYMREKGYKVALFDAMLAQNTDEWTASLKQYQAKYAVLFEDNFNYLSKMSLLRMREAAFEMIDMAKAQGCTVIVTGADMTDHADKYLEHHADYVLVGEGDETLGELIDYLAKTQSVDEAELYKIQGLAYRHDGHMVKTPARPVIRDLNALPFPAWDLVDREKYRSVWMQHHGYYSMNL